MASIKNLKKDIENYVLGDIIDQCLIKPTADDKKVEALIEEAIDIYNELIVKVNAKNIENKKAHFNAIKTELGTRADKLLEKVNKL